MLTSISTTKPARPDSERGGQSPSRKKIYKGSGLADTRRRIFQLRGVADVSGKLRNQEAYNQLNQAYGKVLDHLDKKLQGEKELKGKKEVQGEMTQLILEEIYMVGNEYRETLGKLSRGSQCFNLQKKIGECHRAMQARLGKFDDPLCDSLASKHAWDASVAYGKAYVFGKRHSPPTDPVVLGLCNSLAVITWDLLRDKHRSCAILEGAIKEVTPDMIPHLSDESRLAFWELEETLQAMKREEPHWATVTSPTL